MALQYFIVIASEVRSPDERSDIRDNTHTVPDIALMSFVKWFEREISSPCDFRRSAVVMIVQRWRRSLKTSVIKL